MNKRGASVIIFAIIFLLVLLILSLNIITAQEDLDAELDGIIDNADAVYAILKSKVAGKCDSLNQDQITFSLMALGYDEAVQQECKDALMAKSDKDECWPDNKCNVKDTSLALYALAHNGFNTDEITTWLENQAGETDVLTWFLQIDITTGESADCEISYNNKDYNIEVLKTRKIKGSVGSCLSLSNNDYWFEIDEDCLDEEFEITCEDRFVTSLFYTREGSSTIYLPSLTHIASADDKTTEKVISKCFEKSKECDYESTAWATLALQKAGKSTSPYIHYLIAFGDDNKELMPDAFLYMLTNYNDYLNNLKNQKVGNYWVAVDSPYNEYYASSLALLALQGDYLPEADDAKDYFLENTDKDGWWKTIDDTAFLLYAGWPQTPTFAKNPCPGGESYCGADLSCIQAGGQVSYDYYCSNSADVCCTEKIIEKTCSEQSGTLCQSGESCDGTQLQASDAIGRVCCIGTCEEYTPQGNDCEDMGDGICRYSCLTDEKRATTYDYACDGDVCCVTDTSKPFPIWIIILIILIALVVLGIIFRNKLKKLLSNLGKKKPKQSGPPRPYGPGFPPRPPLMPRGRPMRPIRRRGSSPSEKGISETLKKLKEMSK